MHNVFIVAEAGVNHNGSLKIAKKMVDIAASAGADAIKFQTFHAESLVSKFAPKAEYQKKTTGKEGSQFTMIREYELDLNAHKSLIDYCRKKGIMFLSSPFDLESIDMLNGFGLEMFKIPSGEITNLPYLRKIGRLRKKIIMSTGMSDLKEIKEALRILRLVGTPKKNVTLLHCTSEYPASMERVNLSAMTAIKESLRVNVGYSDHTQGIEVPIAAVAMGAKVIEKHFTLDKDMQGPDHKSSLEPDELKAMIKAIRNIEKAFGDGVKRPTPQELNNRIATRKSIVASANIAKGELFTENNITVKRPGGGISPIEWNRVIAKRAKKNFKEDELIEL